MKIQFFTKDTTIFLLDASGAFVSAVLLFLLYRFEAYFGMPGPVLLLFIGIAVVLCLYSTLVYLIRPRKWASYLKIVALLNMGYCVYTFYHVLRYFEVLTLYGKLYFGGELLIIVSLAIYELRTAIHATRR